MFYIPFSEVQRDRPNRGVRTVPGTRRLHSIRNVNTGQVAIRNLSCFCEPCVVGIGVCENELYVHPWKEGRIGKLSALLIICIPMHINLK